MTADSKIYNTLPYGKDPFWQFVVIPTISILHNVEKSDKYTVVNVEWLFWSFTTMFK